jgi:nitronate monooxygenase
MWTSTKITQRLGLDVPIVQGPFGSGLSAVDLVVAVCEAGGLGSFGVHHLDGTGIRQVAASIRERTRRPFALNLWIPLLKDTDAELSDARYSLALSALHPYFAELGVAPPERPTRFIPNYQEQIEAVLEVGPAVFSFVFGIPEVDVLEQCRRRGIATIGAATTPDEAVALEQAGVEMIVATGFEAGGHRVSFMRSAEQSLTGTLSLVPQVVDSVRVPVIAAGGIADGRGVAAALCLGAQAVQIGTAFLACEESSASALHREKLRSADARYTALTRVFTGRLARGIDNRFVQQMKAHEPSIAPYPMQAWLTAQLKSAALSQSRADLLALWCGQSAPLLRHKNARALMESLIAQTAEVFDRTARAERHAPP